MADFQQLFQLGQQMQGRLQQLQTELAKRTIETSSGGGMVRVTADGQGTVRAVRIDPAIWSSRPWPRRSGARRSCFRPKCGRSRSSRSRRPPDR